MIPDPDPATEQLILAAEREVLEEVARGEWDNISEELVQAFMAELLAARGEPPRKLRRRGPAT